MTTQRLAFALPLIIASLTCGTYSADLNVPGQHKTIQAAINAASSGDTVLVASGVYNERIKLKAGVTLRSVGDNSKGKLGLKRAEATIIDGGGDKGTGAGVDMAEGSTVDGFTVRNVGLYDDAAWNKHYATQGEQQEYEHIGAPGIAGIAAMGVNCTIRNNIVYHIGYTGIAAGGMGKAAAPLVINNISYRNMGGGIGAMKGSKATIQGNTCFENFYAGIGHEGHAVPTVIENICYNNVRAGIGISEGASPVVKRNRCYKNRRAGIGIRTGQDTRPLVEDNDCYDNDMAGIGTREDAAPTIQNNRCYRNKMAGIGSRTGATPTIIGNECYENGRSGIGQMSGTKTVLKNNYLHHNKASGIGYARGRGGESTVENNRVIDNGLVAVGVNPGWKVTLTGNEFSRKGGLPPIIMVFSGSTATFKNNVIRGGGVAGIRAAGTVIAEGNEFAGTSLRRVGPPNFAIWGLKGSRVEMKGNKVNSWRHALSSGEGHVTATGNQVSNFHRAAFVISKAASAPNVSGNQISGGGKGAVELLVDGKSVN